MGLFRNRPFIPILLVLTAIAGCGGGGGGPADSLAPVPTGDNGMATQDPETDNNGNQTDTDGGDTGGSQNNGDNGQTGGSDTGGSTGAGGDSNTGNDNGGANTGGNTGDNGGTDAGGDTGDNGGSDNGGDNSGTVSPPTPPPPPVSPFTTPSQAEALYFIDTLPGDFAFVRDNSLADRTLTDFSVRPAPPAGTVDYQGFMELLFQSQPGANIKGAASLTVTMDSGATVGTASQFIGYVLNPDTNLEELALYEGQVTLSGGQFSAFANGGTAYSVTIDGALDNGLQTFTVTGDIDGAVYGPGAEGLRANGSRSLLSDDITLTVDGSPVDGTAAIWALKQ